MDSNDSPEIPDRGETSDIPGLPGGGGREWKMGQECGEGLNGKGRGMGGEWWDGREKKVELEGGEDGREGGRGKMGGGGTGGWNGRKGKGGTEGERGLRRFSDTPRSVSLLVV